MLGLAWLYLQPLGMLAAYFLLFDVVFGMRLGEEAGATRMGVYLVVGMSVWLAFSDNVVRGQASIVESGGLLQKSALPLALFPARATLASVLVFAPFFLFLLIWAFVRNGPVPALVALPLVFALQTVFFFFLVYLLALLVAAMRDAQQVVIFGLSVGMFCSPVLYPVSFVPEAFRWLLWLNPMTPFVLAWQELVLSGQLPASQLWMAMVAWVSIAAAFLTMFLKRAREQVVDWL